MTTGESRQHAFYRLTPAQQQFAIEQAHGDALDMHETVNMHIQRGYEIMARCLAYSDLCWKVTGDLEAVQPGSMEDSKNFFAYALACRNEGRKP